MILALDFLEHFSRNELAALLSKIRLALKPEGLLVLRTPNGQGLFSGVVAYGDLTHLTILNPGSLRQALQIAGLKVVSIREIPPLRRGFRGWARAIGWATLRSAARLAYKVETGKTQTVWTENVIRAARRPAGS